MCSLVHPSWKYCCLGKQMRAMWPRYYVVSIKLMVKLSFFLVIVMVYIGARFGRRQTDFKQPIDKLITNEEVIESELNILHPNQFKMKN